MLKSATGILIQKSNKICKPGNQPLRVKAESLVRNWTVRELGLSGKRDEVIPDRKCLLHIQQNNCYKIAREHENNEA